MYALRPATQADFDFLYRLHIATMRKYVEETWGWDEQFQQEFFKTHFDPSKNQIILKNKNEIGVLGVEQREKEIFLAEIEILPEFQNRGIGSAIISDLIDKAKKKRECLSLHVLKVNPARDLYERLGFRLFGESRTHYRMKFQPET